MSSVASVRGDRIELSEEIEVRISELLEPRAARAAAYGAHFSHLWQLACQCIQGGKLLRPRLLMEAFDALADGRDRRESLREAALQLAAATELLHFSFLLHDDVIDEDLLRRGRPNLIGAILHDRDPAAQESRGSFDDADVHWARSNGILLGDLMLAAAHQVFARAEVPPPLRLRLLDLLDHTITESVAGEQLDVGLGDRVIPSDLAAVLEMTRLKTATYSFELPLRAAAILTDAEPRLEDAVGAISRHLGVAFQLQDDLLSAFGASDEHGKDAFSDFREGKETAIIAYARLTNDWPRIEPLFARRDLSDADGLEIRAMLSQCGAEGFVRSLVDEQIRTVLDTVSSEASGVPRELAAYILRLIDALEGRRS